MSESEPLLRPSTPPSPSPPSPLPPPNRVDDDSTAVDLDGPSADANSETHGFIRYKEITEFLEKAVSGFGRPFFSLLFTLLPVLAQEILSAIYSLWIYPVTGTKKRKEKKRKEKKRKEKKRKREAGGFKEKVEEGSSSSPFPSISFSLSSSSFPFSSSSSSSLIYLLSFFSSQLVPR